MKIGSYGYTADNPNRGKAPCTIYHNPKCRKSCEALDLLRANGIELKVVEYLVTPLKKHEIKDLLSLLKVDPKEILRTGEEIFSTLQVDLENTESIAEAIAAHPVLLQRPIITQGDKAVIARPPEKALAFFGF